METNHKLKIFLVDDNLFCLNLYQQRIKNLGYPDVIFFQDGNECITNLVQNPNVIFLDYNMDNLNRFDLLKKIKSYDPNIYIVMVSAQEEIKTAVSSVKYGIFDYVVKGDNDLRKIENVLLRINEIQALLKNRLKN